MLWLVESLTKRCEIMPSACISLVAIARCFEAYRELIEDLASEAFDAEGPFDRDGRVLVTSDAIAR